MSKLVQIHDSRYPHLEDQFQTSYFQHIISFLKQEKQTGRVIYPAWANMFKAFELSPRDATKVVILGQDPYHGVGQAHGLCFSVPDGVTPPPSLLNIYKELEQEYPDHKANFSSGNLSPWANQWILLLNSFLSVEAGRPLSHAKIGREQFTDHIIATLSAQKEWLVFMLWWNFAISKSKLIDNHKHLILTAAHPSPLSAYKGRFGCNHFKLCNEYLQSKSKKPIQWL